MKRSLLVVGAALATGDPVKGKNAFLQSNLTAFCNPI
jgi:hypothetical protein